MKPEVLNILDYEKHNVVEASAGTGKTYLIEHAVAELIITKELTIDDILLVTFTEKAAAELRDRIRNILARLCEDKETVIAWGGDAASLSRLRDSSARVLQAPIYTIHGFCLRILRDFAFVSGREFEEEQAERATVFDVVFSKVVREHLAVDPKYVPFLRAWRAHRSTSMLRDQMFSAIRTKGEIRPAYRPENDRRLLLLADSATLKVQMPFLKQAIASSSVHGSSRAKVKRLTEQFLSLMRELRESADVPAFFGSLESEYKGMLDYLDEKLGAATGLGEQLQGVTEIVREVKSLVVPLTAACLSFFVPILEQEMKDYKREQGVLDFQDMLELLAEAIDGENGKQLKDEVGGRYQFVFVDEFQDTDELQWSIFQNLFATEKNKLILVGDPKQAIYGFRGADLQTYFSAKKSIVSNGGNLASLTGNYRSTPGVVDGINLLLSEVFGSFFTGKVRYDKPTVSCSDRQLLLRGQPCVPIVVLAPTPAAGTKLYASDISKQLHHSIAEECKKLLDTNDWDFKDGNHQRALTASDIFILTRTTLESNQIAEVLAQNGIPHSVYKQEGLFQTIEAREILDVLEAIRSPEDVGRRARAMRTRFLGVSLAELKNYKGHSDIIIDDWCLASAELPGLFARILTDTNLTVRLASIAGGERLLTNYQHVFEVLLSEADREGYGLSGVVSFLRKMIRDPHKMRSQNIKRLDVDRESISIMTMHAAKGLEAAVVFLCGGLGGGMRFSQRTYHEGNVRCLEVGPPRASTKAQVEAEAVQEDQRLLYVAMTRAIGRLYLPFVDPAFARSRGGAYTPVNDRLNGIVSGLQRNDALAKKYFSLRKLDAKRSNLRMVSAQSARNPCDLSPLEQSQVDSILMRHNAARVHSYSSLKGSESIKLSDDVVALDDVGGAKLGVFVHEVLERLTQGGATDDVAWLSQVASSDFLKRSVARLGLSPREVERALELVNATWTVPLLIGDKLVGSLSEMKILARESEFFYTAGEETIRGIIDMLVECDDKIFVVDYKTDRLIDYTDERVRVHTEMHYGVQAALYGEAVGRMYSKAQLGGAIYLYCRGMDRQIPGQGVSVVSVDQARIMAQQAGVERMLRE